MNSAAWTQQQRSKEAFSCTGGAIILKPLWWTGACRQAGNTSRTGHTSGKLRASWKCMFLEGRGRGGENANSTQKQAPDRGCEPVTFSLPGSSTHSPRVKVIFFKSPVSQPDVQKEIINEKQYHRLPLLNKHRWHCLRLCDRPLTFPCVSWGKDKSATVWKKGSTSSALMRAKHPTHCFPP